MNVLHQWLLMVAVQSTVLLIAFLVLLRWWSVNPFSRQILSSAAITTCMLLPLAICLVPATLTTTISSQLITTQTNQASSPPMLAGERSISAGTVSVSPAPENTFNQAAKPPVPTPVSQPSVAPVSWEQAILSVWAIGFSAMLFTRLARQLKLRQLVKSAAPVAAPAELSEHLTMVFGRPTSPRLLLIDHNFVPFVVGLLRPSIVLPKTLLSDIELLKQVVTHEQAHVYRRDTWGLFWQQFVSAVFWWQPLLKFMNRELSAARECIADSYVVAHCDPVSYAENILRLAEAAPPDRTMALAFLHQPPSLEDRVRHILIESHRFKNRWLWSSRGCSVVLAAMVLFLCGGIAYQSQLNARETASQAPPSASATPAPTVPAAPTAQTGLEAPTSALETTPPASDAEPDFLLAPMIQDTEPRHVTGRVLSPTGQPVDECLLLAEVYTRDRQAQIISTRTDDQGRFKLTLPGDVGHPEPYDTWIYKQGYGLRAVAFGHRLARSHRWDDATIVLPVADRMTVEVRDPDGQPVAGAEIEPVSHEVPNGSFSADSAEGLASYIPAAILELVRAKTNAAGTAELNCFNAKLMRELQATSATYGTQRFDSATSPDWKLEFRPVGSLRVKLVGGDATKAKGSILNFQSEPYTQAPPLAVASGMAQLTLDGQSEFVVPNLPEGRLQIWSWSWKQSSEYLPFITTIPDVIADTETVVEVRLMPSIEVKGRVLLPDGSQPAKGVALQILGRGAFSESSQTDDEGNFRVYALPGPAQINFNALGAGAMRGYRLPKGLSINVPKASPLSVPDVKLEKVPELTVHISDAAGQPLIDTEVIMAVHFRDRIHPLEKLKTNRDGSFRTPLDFEESESQMRQMDPHAGYRFYLANDYIKQAPVSSVPLKEIRRRNNEVWLKK